MGDHDSANAHSKGHRLFDYAAFIDELQTLIPRGKEMIGVGMLKGNVTFRTWKHEVSDALLRVERLGYERVNCAIDQRPFSLLRPKTPADQPRKFDSAMRETLAELQLVVRNFEQYGPPALKTGAAPVQSVASQAAVASVPKGWPDKDKVTLAWLWHHMPATAWLAVAGLAGTAYLVGFNIGEWKSKTVQSAATSAVPSAATANASTPSTTANTVAKPASEASPSIANAASTSASSASKRIETIVDEFFLKEPKFPQEQKHLDKQVERESKPRV